MSIVNVASQVNREWAKTLDDNSLITYCKPVNSKTL